jgi:nicotinamidase-related amidase
VTIEYRTPQNTAIVLVDYVTGFANVLRSQPIFDNVTGAVALARTAQGYQVPLVVTAGPELDPRGPLYPELTGVLGDHPVVHRGGPFNAFEDASFAAAVAATGRKHLVIAGLATEGCILFTTMGALQLGYEVSIVVDATAGENQVVHEAALGRMATLGVTQTSWLTLATELQVSYDRPETANVYYDILNLSPGFGKNMITLIAAQEFGAALEKAENPGVS